MPTAVLEPTDQTPQHAERCARLETRKGERRRCGRPVQRTGDDRPAEREGVPRCTRHYYLDESEVFLGDPVTRERGGRKPVGGAVYEVRPGADVDVLISARAAAEGISRSRAATLLLQEGAALAVRNGARRRWST